MTTQDELRAAMAAERKAEARHQTKRALVGCAIIPVAVVVFIVGWRVMGYLLVG